MPNFRDGNIDKSQDAGAAKRWGNLTTERAHNVTTPLNMKLPERILALGIKVLGTQADLQGFDVIPNPSSKIVEARMQMFTREADPYNKLGSGPTIWEALTTCGSRVDHFLLSPDAGVVLPIFQGNHVTQHVDGVDKLVIDAYSPPSLKCLALTAVEYRSGAAYNNKVASLISAMRRELFVPEEAKIDAYKAATLPFVIENPAHLQANVADEQIKVMPDFGAFKAENFTELNA